MRETGLGRGAKEKGMRGRGEFRGNTADAWGNSARDLQGKCGTPEIIEQLRLQPIMNEPQEINSG